MCVLIKVLVNYIMRKLLTLYCMGSFHSPYEIFWTGYPLFFSDQNYFDHT